MDILIQDEVYLIKHLERSRDLCRCCLSECEDGVGLFSEQSLLDGMFYVDAAQILVSCFDIIVTLHDNLPQVLCRPCVSLAKATFIMRKRCEKADKILRKTLVKKNEIISTPSKNSTIQRKQLIEFTPENKIVSNFNSKIDCKFQRKSSIFIDCSNFLKTPTHVKTVRRKINMKRESLDYDAPHKQMKRNYRKNKDNVDSESVSRFKIGSDAAQVKVNKEGSCRSTLKSVNSKKMLGRGFKMLELALGRNTVVNEPELTVKIEQRTEKNYDENRIKSYLKDVWRSRHRNGSPYRHRGSSLSDVSLCSFELMTPPKHHFYQNNTPYEQDTKCLHNEEYQL